MLNTRWAAHFTQCGIWNLIRSQSFRWWTWSFWCSVSWWHWRAHPRWKNTCGTSCSLYSHCLILLYRTNLSILNVGLCARTYCILGNNLRMFTGFLHVPTSSEQHTSTARNIFEDGLSKSHDWQDMKLPASVLQPLRCETWTSTGSLRNRAPTQAPFTELSLMEVLTQIQVTWGFVCARIMCASFQRKKNTQPTPS